LFAVIFYLLSSCRSLRRCLTPEIKFYFMAGDLVLGSMDLELIC